MRIDFLGLQGFLSIAEQGSFQRAAANLGLSQTALSHRLAKLEADLGVNLVARTTRQVTLTAAGTVLLPKARRLIEELGESVEEVRRLGGLRQERITIACIPTVAMSYLPRLLLQFGAENPDILVTVRDTTSHEILDLVESGTVEFGISVVTATRPGLEIRPLLKEQFVLACPARHKLAKLDSVSWSQLDSESLIRNSVVGNALGNRREGMNWRYEIVQVATALSMVRCGLGLTVVPRLCIEAGGISELAAVRLRSPTIARTLGLLSRRGAHLSEAGQSLWSRIEGHMEEFAGIEAADAVAPARRSKADGVSQPPTARLATRRSASPG